MQTRRQNRVRRLIVALVTTGVTTPTTPLLLEAAGICTVLEAPLPEPEPPGDPVSYCDSGAQHGRRCTESADCDGGVCSLGVRTHNRYLAFQPPASWSGQQVALRVTLVSIDGFPSFNGQTRWVGTAQSFPDYDITLPPRPFLAAPTVGAPVYQEWALDEPTFVFGSEIVPGGTSSFFSVYAIQAISDGCDLGDEANYSDPLVLTTALWGDVAPPHADPSLPPQPSYEDPSGAIQKFKASSALRLVEVQLLPNIPDPAFPASMRELRGTVAAFMGNRYSELLTGPETCPHRIPGCGDGIRDPSEQCDDGNTTPNDGCDENCVAENATAVFRVVPVEPPDETGVVYPPGVVFSGNEFLLDSGGVRLWFEVRLEGWGGELGVWQATLAAPFANGTGAELALPVVTSTDRTECEALFGTGARVDRVTATCTAGFQNSRNPDFAINGISGVSQADVAFGSAQLPGLSGEIDDGREYYGGTLVLDVPEGAAGTFVLGFETDLRLSFMDGAFGSTLPIAQFEPAIVRLPGGCCLGNSCASLLASECLDRGGVPVDTCGGDCNGNGQADVCEVINGNRDDCNDNLIPDDCEPDCNGNGTVDDCDLSAVTDLDCNGNDIPDECDLADAASADCNANNVPDECDIATQASGDCNFNGVPDDCEPDEDCNTNGTTDICDIGAGTSDDCNFDLVPDDCQPDEDCNTNSVRDLCDIGTGTELDCNGNLSPDSCDIAGGGSFDDNVDGVPDECCESPTPVFVLEKKSRFLSLASVGTLGVRQAIRVTFIDNASYPELNFQALWVGAPREYPEEDSSQLGLTFTGAGLSCTPHYQDWSAIDVLHVFGAEIVPSSAYAAQVINEGCPEEFPTNYSGALPASTGKWGDQSPLFDGPGNPPSPDFNDIAGSVQKFKASPGAPIKALAQLQPNVVLPSRAINFKDIAATTSAFIGTAYVDTVPNAGPCTCPSGVTCGATVCANDLECGAGFCIDGSCTDACGRCRP